MVLPVALERKTGLALARGASDFPRIVANTPGPWEGSLEVAGDGSASQTTQQQGEPLRFSLLLWSGKRDLHSRGARVFSREQLLTPPAPGRGALRSQGTRARSLRTFQREKGEPFWFSLFSLSGKRDSDPRPQPWQGCALPTELFPHDVSLNASAKVTKISESPNFSRTNPYFLSPHPAVAPPLAAQTGKQKLPSPATADQIAHAFPFAVLCRKRPFGHPFPRLPKHEPATSVVFLHGIFSEILSLWA